MNRYLKAVTALLFCIVASILAKDAIAEGERSPDPNQLFYTANNLYEKQDYLKAVEDYISILDSGFESGNLYYNIGNGFFKLGKMGYAVLCYERAKRLIPHDSDLKSNLAYARSLTSGAGFDTDYKNLFVRIFKKPFSDLSLSKISVSCLALYLVVILAIAAFIFKPLAVRKYGIPFLVIFVLFLVNLAAFAVRYYDEEILTHGIVIQKEAECRYEPIDTSTTYYKVHEAEEVLVVKTKNGWSQIKRYDGKVGWVKKEAVEVM